VPTVPVSTFSKEANSDLSEVQDGNKADNEDSEKEMQNLDFDSEIYFTNDQEANKAEKGAVERVHHDAEFVPDDFRVGDIVTAKKIEPDIEKHIEIWEEATIIQDTGVSFKLQFERDDPKYNREIDKEFIEGKIYPRGYK